MRTSVSIVLIALLLVPTVSVSPAQAQTAHAAPQATLDAALRQHAADAAQDRELVQRVLQRAEVRDVAGRMGVDLRRAEGAVATLSDQELAQVAAQARQVDETLAGGASTLVISTTTIIIALLIVILLVVAID
jgi:hypothetical protein